MKSFRNNFDYYFLALVAVELICVQFYPSGRLVTKPLLMISLMAFYVLSSAKIDKLFLIALFFAFLGDTFLLSDNYFLHGLGSFLIMQVLYAICFFKQFDRLTKTKIMGVVAISLLLALMLYQLVPKLDEDVLIPVIIYSLTIGLMAIAAVSRVDQGSQYKMVLGGVISFLISDSLLGLNKFGDGFEVAGLLVMLTYIIAQYLIVKGYLRHEQGNNATSETYY